jgi:catechol-2,3-dioxygenase
MTVKVVKLGFLGLNVVKYDEMTNHYENILGLPRSSDGGNSESYFVCGPDHHAVSFHKSDKPGFRHVGFQIEGDGPLEGALTDLRESGIPATLQMQPLAGLKCAIQIADPDGYSIYLYRTVAASTVPRGHAGIDPNKLGHVALRVGNAGVTTKFYTDVLGFRWSDWLEDFFVFLRCGADHHTMNFINSARRGMFHVAFEANDWSHLGRSCDILAAHSVPLIWGPGRHGIGHNLFAYHYDPDGNIVELFAELDRMSDERIGYFDPRSYHEDNPQRPKIWRREPTAANKWGIMPPPDFET